MKLRDALIAEQGADRLPVDVDRRLRRRLGLDAPASRRVVWLRPALAAFAVAALVALVLLRDRQPAAPRVETPKPQIAEVVATPGAQLTRTSTTAVTLTQGTIKIQGAPNVPMHVTVPMGRVVISAYRSTVTVDREMLTIVLDDGTGQYTDADGKTHPLVAKEALVWPAPREQVPDAPAPVKRTPKRANVAPAPVETPEPQAAPGETPPTVPRAQDVPCTFKSECEPGATCRKNEDGISVCMGNGGDGAACWFDNDCKSRHCVQRRCAP